MEQNEERRKSYRLPFHAKVACHSEGEEFHGTIDDLSASGLFMVSADRPTISSKCSIEIVLDGDNSRLTIDRLKGMVVRSDDRGVGISFDDKLEWLALAPIYFHKMRDQSEN